MKHLLLILATALALASFAPAAAPDQSSQIKKWLADLADSDADVREQARFNLMGLGRDDLPALRKLVEAGRPMEPSQLSALPEIVRHIFLRGDRYETIGDNGFLGARLGDTAIPARLAGVEQPADMVSAVMIMGRLPGFCAERSLREGDVILSVTEQPGVIATPQNFKTIIVNSRAGATIHMKILRLGHVITVPVTLDPRPDAAAAGTPDEVEVQMEKLQSRRAEEAGEYWRKNFAPLVGEKVG